MRNKAEQIEYLKELLASSQHFEEVFKEFLKLQSSKQNLFLLLQGNYLSEKKAFNQGIITHDEFKRYEDRARNALMEIIDSLECENKFIILNSPEVRTKRITEDLNEIYKKDKFADTLIWSVSFLSIFAIGDSNTYFNSKKEKDLIALLEKEKQALLKLASAGCEIRCIISPVNPKSVSENLEYALYRTIQLLDFLNNKNSDTVIESA